MDGTISLDRLSWFLAVAETGSFTAAALRLGVPKSSLSRRIDRLEREVGVRLLHRTTRRVSLSSAGATLFEGAVPAMRALREVFGSLPEREALPSGELRITAPNDVGVELLADLIPAFSRRYPRVVLDICLTNRTVDLVAEGFDLAIRAVADAPADSGMVMRRLRAAVLGIFASPSYLARRGTPRTLEETVSHDWIVFRSDRLQRPARPPGHVVAGADDFQFIRNAVRAGAGLARLPVLLTGADLGSGRLVRVLPRETWGDARLFLMYPKTPQVPRKLIAFRDFVLEHLGEAR
jgi:DNA-binding transcriptional LysR family regulator